MGKRRPEPSVRTVVDVHERQSGIVDVLADEFRAEVELAPLPGIGRERARSLAATLHHRFGGS